MTTNATQPSRSTEAQQLIAMQILEIAMNTPKTTAGITVTYDGDNNGIDVRIYNGGWSEARHSGVGPDFQRTFYFDMEYYDKAEDSAERLIELVRAHIARVEAEGISPTSPAAPATEPHPATLAENLVPAIIAAATSPAQASIQPEAEISL